MSQQKTGGSKKLRRSSRKKGYFAQQAIRTTVHKNHRARKRRFKKEFWVMRKVKKDGVTLVRQPTQATKY